MINIENCHITHFPASVLGRSAQPVDVIDDDIVRLVDKMAEIMMENKGIGLAAPQAGLALRVFIISLDGTRESVKVYINPTITTEGDLAAAEEGCLSVPGVYTNIQRFKRCSVTATDLDGNEFTEEAEGLYAKALQHEYDHIEGMTIIDRMGMAGKIAHRRQLKKLQEKCQNPE